MLMMLIASSAQAMSDSECASLMTYLEARSLPKRDWQLTANVAYNRTKQDYLFAAKSHRLCDQVQSHQFTSYKKWDNRIKEPDKLKEIKQYLSANDWKHQTNALYFSTVNHKMVYSRVWHGRHTKR